MVQKAKIYSKYINPEIFYVLVGSWLLLVPFVFGYYQKERSVEFIIGLILLMTGSIPLMSPERGSVWQKTAQFLAGLALISAPFFMSQTLTVIHHILMGILIIVFTGWRIHTTFSFRKAGLHL